MSKLTDNEFLRLMWYMRINNKNLRRCTMCVHFHDRSSSFCYKFSKLPSKFDNVNQVAKHCAEFTLGNNTWLGAQKKEGGTPETIAQKARP